jgi:hypothetical protein
VNRKLFLAYFFSSQVIDMVYIRHIAPIVAPSVLRTVGEPVPVSAEHSVASDVVENEYLARPQVERRKQKDDRRQQRKDALLETRAGRDRRKSKPTISISI